MISPVEYLSAVLRARVAVTEAQVLAFGPGEARPRHVVALPKVILVCSGEMDYRIDGRLVRLREGDMFYRPASSAALWSIPRECSIGWCEFRVEPELREPSGPLLRTGCDTGVELAAFGRIRDLHQRGSADAMLEAEGELKGVLARFLAHATPLFDRTDEMEAGRGAETVRKAIAWLGRHFAEASAAGKVHERTGLNVDHFRREFKRVTGTSPGQYVTRLRMQAARFYLQRTDQSIKEISRQVGYGDPLYFSRVYRRYWGVAPTSQRSSSRER